MQNVNTNPNFHVVQMKNEFIIVFSPFHLAQEKIENIIFS
jgi:hypothetical protein